MNFRTKFTVRIGDINYGGHLGNEKALLLFHDARIRFFESMGYSELNIGSGIGIILSEAKVKYKKEVFLHDELDVMISIDNISTSAFTIIYNVMRESDGAEVIWGSTQIVAYNYSQKKVAKLPDEFKSKLVV
jgi:acyl-CoA thioester hydrolase